MRLALALALSGGMHVVGYGLLRACHAPVVPLAPPRSVDFVVVDPGKGDVPRGPGSASNLGTAKASLMPAHARARAARSKRQAVAAPIVAPAATTVATLGDSSPGAAMALPVRGESGASGDEGSRAAGSAELPGGAGTGSPRDEAQAPRLPPSAPPIDLSPFYHRLQASAHRCAGVRPGSAKVHFCVGEGGAPTDVALVQSSGNFALDEAAVSCVVPGAAPFPPLDRCLTVPVTFR
jgi:TonB family protein